MIRRAHRLSAPPAGQYGGSQHGAIALMCALTLLVMLGFIGLALDLGRVYNRAMEMQAAANAVALAAANELNGKASGVSAAQGRAASTMAQFHYQYSQYPMRWNDQALSFGAAADGDWVGAAAAKASAADYFFVQVDTGKLDAPASVIDLVIMRVFGPALARARVAIQARAGRTSINVAPIAVCAMSAVAAEKRSNGASPALDELVEYGFRRGVGYDLMQLNPGATTPENFVIDPLTPPGMAGVAVNTTPAMVGPFACTGQLALPRISGAALSVRRPFPLAALSGHLNTRFDTSGAGPCSYSSAPPDRNIRAYPRDSATLWMTAAPAGQGAQASTTGGKLWTVADPVPAPTSNNAAMYGVLWAHARAVPYSAYLASPVEPAAGYTSFNPADWSGLYPPAAPVAKSYPASATPYAATNGSHFLAPPMTQRGLASRRALHVALLACPVAAGTNASASVRGIGRFFMTVPATASSLPVEFGGLVAEETLRGEVLLYR